MKSMGFHCMTTIVPWVMQYMLIPLKCMCVFLVLLRISIEYNQTKWRVSHDLRVILLNKRRPCYQMLERERERLHVSVPLIHPTYKPWIAVVQRL